MKLRNYSILFILVIISFFILFQLLASEFIVKKGFQQFEEKHARLQVNTARRALNLQLENLDKLLIDWANWDDSYDFVQPPPRSMSNPTFPLKPSLINRWCV